MLKNERELNLDLHHIEVRHEYRITDSHWYFQSTKERAAALLIGKNATDNCSIC